MITFANMRATALAALLLSGCATVPAPEKLAVKFDPNKDVNKKVASSNQDSRIRTLVLHYTALDFDNSLKTLTNDAFGVSAHYLVADDAHANDVYELVPENRRSWHAGVSEWRGVNNINFSSVGIEIVNFGFPPGDNNLPLMQRRWYPYTPAQVAAIGKLSRNIVDRYQLQPYQVVGHSDIAPGRKWDPGPHFPWQQLSEQYGVGAWPDRATVEQFMTTQPFDGNIASLQQKLSRYGYATPKSGQLDPPTRDVIVAFQAHFRPALYNGTPDVETVAILDALLAKYFPSPK